MPMVRIELYPGRSAEQKLECARAVIEAVQKHLGAPAEATHVVFVDVPKVDWHVGGNLPPPASTG